MTKINFRLSVLALPRVTKRLIVILVDACLAIFAVWISYYLRIGEFIPLFERYHEHYAFSACVVTIVVSLPLFMIFGLYRMIFRYSSLSAMVAVGKAIIVYAIIYSTIFTFIGIEGVPRTIGIIQPIILLLLIIFSRFAAWYWLSGMYIEQLQLGNKPRALIFGAGSAGRELAAALAQNVNTHVIGFLDDDPKIQDNKINGLTVYNPRNIDKIIMKKRVNEVMLALPSADRHRRNKILNLLRKKNVVVRTLPSYSDLMQGKVNVENVRELSIDDILGRDLVEPKSKLMQADITGKVILVTGAGGSIGSELSRQIYLQNPKKLILFDHSEFALYTIFEEIKKISYNIKAQIDIVASLGSVTDDIKIKQLLNKEKPNTIYHTAAYKHVPLVEANQIEGIKNNLYGTLNLSKAAIKAKVNKFILVSTDKAVRPTNVMGASKRLAEMVLQALSTKQNNTIFAMVRFGNVLDSSGSVVPLFKSQIRSGGPLTLTDQNVTRYFMTITEAAELVIQAGAMTKTIPKKNVSAPIYLLEMGTPIKIYDLAQRMIELSGLKVLNKITGEGDIEIKIIGLRPGEKLHEELLIDNVSSNTTHSKIKLANESFIKWRKLKNELSKIKNAIDMNHQAKVKKILSELVTGFNSNNLT